MTDRHRYLVALVVRGRHSTEINALRRALSSPDLDRIAPHITVIAPINVASGEEANVVELLRRIADQFAPIAVELGPPAMFASRTDVVYLEVGDEIDVIRRLRKQLSTGPLIVPSSREERPFIPHVTLSTKLRVDRAQAALSTLRGYVTEYRFDAVTLMEQDLFAADHPWQTVADFAFGQNITVGRGGREIEFSFSREPDPTAAQFFSDAWSNYVIESYGTDGNPPEPYALVARIGFRVVGVAIGSATRTEWKLDRLIVERALRGEGIGGQLLRRLEHIAAESGGRQIRLITKADGPARRLYAQHGYAVTADLPNWRQGQTFVVMTRYFGPATAPRSAEIDGVSPHDDAQ